jgi:hypothetical protein
VSFFNALKEGVLREVVRWIERSETRLVMGFAIALPSLHATHPTVLKAHPNVRGTELELSK